MRYGCGGLMKQETKQNATQKAEQEAKYAELLDARTHLTVAILAAAQLKRRNAQGEDVMRLYDYLDRSLAQLQQDIVNLESLILCLQEAQPAPLPRSHRFPPRWVGMGIVFLAAKLRQSFVLPHPQTARPAA